MTETTTDTPAAAIDPRIMERLRSDPEVYGSYFVTGYHLSDDEMAAALWEYDLVVPGRVTREWWRFVPCGPGGDGMYSGYYHPAEPHSRGATRVTIADGCEYSDDD